MSETPQAPIPVATPVKSFPPPPPLPAGAYPGPGGPRRRGMPAWGIVLIVLGGLVVVVVPLAALLLPAFGYSQFVANKGMCKHKLASMATTTKVLAYVSDSPSGSKWIEGLDYDASANTHNVAIANDNIKKSRLAFWRMIADPAITSMNISPGGPTVFICPGSTDSAKTPAQLSIGAAQRDFPSPRRNLFYSMFNQGLDGIVPDYGTRPGFVIMGDRSPQDDGYALNANSANHRWGNENTGQNVCYSAGIVEWVESTNVGIDEDEIYMIGASTTIATADAPVDVDDTCLMPVAE